MAKPLPKSKRPAPIRIATDFIIRLVGVSPVQSKKAGPFKFHRGHNALIFEGREIPIQDFNAIVPEVLNRYNGTYSHRLPEVVLLDRSDVSPSPGLPLSESPLSDSPSPLVVFGAVSDEQGTAQDTEPSEQASESAPEGEVPEQDPPTEEIVEPTTPEEAPEESDTSDAPAEETSAPAEETPAPEPPAEVPSVEDPAPAPATKKGGRPPKYGKGGQPVKK